MDIFRRSFPSRYRHLPPAITQHKVCHRSRLLIATSVASFMSSKLFYVHSLLTKAFIQRLIREKHIGSTRDLVQLCLLEADKDYAHACSFSWLIYLRNELREDYEFGYVKAET